MNRLALAALLVAAFAAPLAAQPRVYMITDLALRDPHTYARFLLCLDVTNQSIAGSVNDAIADGLTTDGDGDGLLDLSPIIAALGEGDIATGWASPGGTAVWNSTDPGGELAFHFAACAAPQSSATCEHDMSTPVEYALFSNAVGGTCLTPLPGVTRGYTPAMNTPSAPCFVSDPFTMSLDINGLALQLEEARIAATYVGTPASDLVNGLIYGFLSEAAADTILISASFPVIGGKPISSILPGGAGCCAPHDDRDLGSDGVTLGWWMHFDFQATEVPFIPTGVTVPLLPVHALRLAAPSPSPFRTSTTITCSVPQAGTGRVRILDVSGRVVRTLLEGQLPGGEQVLTWTGRTEDGTPVAPGVYFVRIDWGGEGVTRRVVRLR